MAELTDHPTPEHFRRFRERTLTPQELLEFDDHLSACADCRRSLTSERDVAAAHRVFELEPKPEHLTYEQLVAYVEGTAAEDEAAAFRRHLFRCARCDQEARDLRLIRGELEWSAEAPSVPAQPARPGWLPQRLWGAAAQTEPAAASSRVTTEGPSPPRRSPAPGWLPWLALPAAGAAAVAAVLLGSQVGTLRAELAQQQASSRELRSAEQRLAELETTRRKLEAEHRQLQAKVPTLQREAETLQKENAALNRRLRQAQNAAGGAVIRDGSSTILLDPAGRASRVLRTEPLPQLATAALETGNLDLPQEVRDLLGPATITRGGGARFHLTAPVATRVPSPRPQLEWSPVPQANRYEVVITELAEGAASVEYNAGRATRWTPPTPLEWGRRYVWEVRAYRDEELLGTAPQPPDPAARFEVLPEADAKRLDEELAKHTGSPLTRALLQARAGLLQQAETELSALAEANPGSARLGALLEKVRDTRRLPR